MQFELIIHRLCPYVQRAAIALLEKNIGFDRVDIDLADKPDWFRAISPLGKTPLLRIDGRDVIFESAVICEYLEETQPGPLLHPGDALARARHRGWIEFASAILNDIAGLYNAPDEVAFQRKRDDLALKFAQVENVLQHGPYFSDRKFSLVDAAFGPVFRYFDTFERIVDLALFDQSPKTRDWRAALADRPSVVKAAHPEYRERLWAFLLQRKSHLSKLMADSLACAAGAGQSEL